MNRGKYTVLWELTPVKGAPTPQSYVRASTLPNNKEADADDSDDDEPTVHSSIQSVRNLLFNITTRSP